ncbi:MAG: ion channel [Blastocatellia bacterium]|nr:ion channel [Blastocatellia bacterium]
MRPETPPPASGQQEESRDLGFGAIVTRESRLRLLNRDGTFNVARQGINPWSTINLYHALLTISWGKFLGLIGIGYVLVNGLFGAAYLLCGRDALRVPPEMGIESRFLQAFFFSVHTFGTIGYGNITPSGFAANMLVTVESLFGLLSVAFATGLLFARFSRPTAKIIFSENAIIAPYRDITAFEFRITNARANQIIELSASLIFSRFVMENGRRVRRFSQLPLEREKVTFFSLSWTIVHPIDAASPLHGWTERELADSEAEFLILLTGIDETFSQTVHTRSSYKFDEVVWRAKFGDIYNPPTPTGRLTIDVRKLHSIETIDRDGNHE